MYSLCPLVSMVSDEKPVVILLRVPCTYELHVSYHFQDFVFVFQRLNYVLCRYESLHLSYFGVARHFGHVVRELSFVCLVTCLD